MQALLAALTLQAGWNSALVAVGAGLLGLSAGAAGVFIFLRKRALISDAATHATLPGLALAFIVMAWADGDGRWLPGLLIGSALSAGFGLWLVEAMTRRTRLSEDAAIGAVLSVAFGVGIVLLTVIQTLPFGRQAGLDGFLLGSTAGMLESEARLIAALGLLTALAVFALRRPMTLVAFDPGYAETSGLDIRRVDLAMMGLALAVTVVGLKVVGLILIVALLITPAATARFWTDRAHLMVPLSAGLGGVSAYLGAAISASAPALPTGPVVVLVAFALFMLSLLVSPLRGVAARALRAWRFQRRVHRRQGLLAVARAEPIFERRTLRLLRREGLIRGDGAPTRAGRAAAAKALRDEARWAALRREAGDPTLLELDDGLTPIDRALTPDQISALDRRLGPPQAVA